MKLLLDTHTFIWAISQKRKLPANAISAIEDPENEVFISAVTFWEIAIKIRIKKLEPIGSYGDLVGTAENTGFHPIPLTPTEALTSFQLAQNTHFDPFDRMLIWQAITRDMSLVSGDTALKRFTSDGLRLLWK